MLKVVLMATWLGVSMAAQAELSSNGLPDSSMEAPSLSLRPSGSLRLGYSSSSKMLDDEKRFWIGAAQLKLLPVFGDYLEGKVVLRAVNTDIASNGSTQTDILEGFVTTTVGNTRIRVGKQIIPWGRADAVNPTDNVTPRDYTVLLHREEDERFGLGGVRLDHYFGSDYTLMAFVSPVFRASKFPLPQEMRSLVSETAPSTSFRDPSISVKLDRTGGATDWSVSYYRGFQQMPSLRASAHSTSQPYEIWHEKMSVLGSDVAFNRGSYALRGELAFIHPDAPVQGPVSGMQPYWYAVAGGDRSFSDNLNVNMQLVARYVTRFQAPSYPEAGSNFTAKQNTSVFWQQRRQTFGFTSRLNKKWLNDTLELEVWVLHNFDPRATYYRPTLSYAFNDTVRGVAGAERYSGADQTLFGQLRRNNRVFFDLEFSY